MYGLIFDQKNDVGEPVYIKVIMIMKTDVS